jgi:hypothetical protein
MGDKKGLHSNENLVTKKKSITFFLYNIAKKFQQFLIAIENSS